MLCVDKFYRPKSGEIVKIQSTERVGHSLVFVGSDGRRYNVVGACLDGAPKYDLIHEIKMPPPETQLAHLLRRYNSRHAR